MRFHAATFALLFMALVLACPHQAWAKAPVIACRVVAEFPHDNRTSTQGLFFHDGRFYESSGGYARSFLAEVDPKTGCHLRSVRIPPTLFAEGIAPFESTLYMLTWQAGIVYSFTLEGLEQVSRFSYGKTSGNAEAWGITSDSEHLFISSGTSRLSLHAPGNFDLLRTVEVTDGGRPVRLLNELEYADGLIYANIWKSDRVAIIDPATGIVRAWLDLTPLRSRLGADCGVANGIAYDAKGGRLFVTGKHWDKLFELEIPKL